MLFNSWEFLVILPLTLIGYHYFKNFRIPFLLACSYFFYAYWEWSYLILILGSTVVDFYCSNRIATHTDKKLKKRYLMISIITNLSILAFFKYYNFFNAQADALFSNLGMDYLIPYSGFLLPMGISFYTFQTMAYTIDVYNGKIDAEKKPLNFALYVTFFPQLVAGPIERAGNLLKQFRTLGNLKISNIEQGLLRVVFGLFKKVVIADRLALFVDQIYSSPADYDGSMLMLATVFFAVQIYCDFSGYSDIAIGVAKMFGIDLMENFKVPYLAKNIREFWGRWHISLSTWFRDYVYIPLGGNRKHLYRNILIVFVVSGFWHGANWTFIVWGALHGVYLLITHIALKKVPRLNASKFNVPGVTITFLFACFAWIFFRANSIEDAGLIISKLPQINTSFLADIAYQMKAAIQDPSILNAPLSLNYGEFYFQFTVGDMILSLLLIPLLMVFEYYRVLKPITERPNLKTAVYAALSIGIVLFGIFSNNQFIYFQF